MQEQINRRQFLAAMAATPAVAFLNNNSIYAALSKGGKAGSDEERLIFKSSFEPGEALPKISTHEVVKGFSRSGEHSLMGQVKLKNKACRLRVPFKSSKGKLIKISFWVRSDNGSGVGVFYYQGDKREGVLTQGGIASNRWVPIECSFSVTKEMAGEIEIASPSSWGSKPGKMWIDDLTVTEVEDEFSGWSDNVEDFPVLACDGKDNVWMAIIERPVGDGFVKVCSIKDGERNEVCKLKPRGCSGVAAPAIAAVGDGCVVAFPVEQNDSWRIAYAFISNKKASPTLKYVDCGGNSNVSPCLTVVGDKVCMAWQSNAGDARGIYVCWIDKKGTTAPERISSEGDNSYNPGIVALEDGSVFAAWDSIRDKKANIYGAWYKRDGWQKEKRITDGERIERHPSLAVYKEQVWMTWQGQAYSSKLMLNSVGEQRIVVARIDGDKLMAPKRLFEDIDQNKLYLRPKIAFDHDGRLWLSARESIGIHSGWLPVVWCYSGRKWSKANVLALHQGRWRSIDMIFTKNDSVTVNQYDDLPQDWVQMGIHPDWKSGLAVKLMPDVDVKAASRLEVEPLEMPATKFSLKEKMDNCAADLPKQEVSHEGQKLKLLWGSLHDHTDLSVCGRSVNPPGHDVFANERDIEKLDFCALTDHGYNFDPQQWAYNGEQTRNNHDPGRFITFLGEEWTSSSNPPGKDKRMSRYGHHNVIFLDPYYKNFQDAYDGDISPADLWQRFSDTEFICIPHQLADWEGKGKWNPPTDWELYTDGRIEGEQAAKISDSDAAWLKEAGLDHLLGPGAWDSHGQPIPRSQAEIQPDVLEIDIE